MDIEVTCQVIGEHTNIPTYVESWLLTASNEELMDMLQDLDGIIIDGDIGPTCIQGAVMFNAFAVKEMYNNSRHLHNYENEDEDNDI